jgi:hypothetical protein
VTLHSALRLEQNSTFWADVFRGTSSARKLRVGKPGNESKEAFPKGWFRPGANA